MSRAEFNQLLEAGLRRELTANEVRRLEAHWVHFPADRQVWVEEMGLNRLWQELPDVPVSSNFTAQVLEKATAQACGGAAPHGLARWGWLASWDWMQKAVLVLGAVCVVWLTSLEYRRHSRIELARSLAAASHEAVVPSPDILNDFDAINRLSQVPPMVDNDLLVALE